jgi:hypothetical protein
VGFQTVRMNGTVREGRKWDECDSMIRFCNSDLLRNKSSLLKVYVNDWKRRQVVGAVRVITCVWSVMLGSDA